MQHIAIKVKKNLHLSRTYSIKNESTIKNARRFSHSAL
jgi:hypothetical protein